MPNKVIRVNQIPVKGETQRPSLLSQLLYNIIQNVIGNKNNNVKSIRLIMEDNENNILLGCPESFRTIFSLHVFSDLC